MKRISQFLMFCFSFLSFSYCHAQPLHPKHRFTHQDTLRGTITPQRAWWDAVWYGITVQPNFNKKTIRGNTEIKFKVLETGDDMQIDLQLPMEIATVNWNNNKLFFQRDSNVYLIRFPQKLKKGSFETINIAFSVKPHEAINPPWDGGWIWKKDRKGRPWMTVACQGLGASVWYPCKDHQSDEPDSASLTMIVPDSLIGVGNGR